MSVIGKSAWVLTIFILSGLVIGGVLGQLASQADFLWWLDYGKEFGFTTPLELNLDIIKLTFAISFKLNVASIIGMVIAIFICNLFD